MSLKSLVTFATLSGAAELAGLNGLAGSMLSVKPILGINPEGTIEPIGRARGWGKACEAVVDYVASGVGENTGSI